MDHPDNATLPATGAVVAADNIGGVLYQRVKIVHGADGSATDASGADPLPVSGPLTNAQLAAAGLATDAVAQAIRDRLPSSFLTPGLLPVDTLGTPGTPRVQATSGTAANITLTTTCRRVSMYATTGTWYSISGTATSSSHYIAAGERLDFDVPASTVISVLQESSAGSVRVTELT